ncbi:hypothetical protein MXL46_12340 [Heyndrickxia sporothermodurans]|uniref:Abortive phage infection protein n=1 Tax=Heyndrickxia sporothermodurans TaxID=46224 RepID=A0A150LEL7_9BACI|nr:hypothetical protein [Heyndrickxia sporothermodurans]KYD10172.1 hypothetical protein B4102_0356 [Heyndrickxia sporothermodurans]MBL5768242.1 hypothetical protein [Heyndrickxia sporothermodurans]MBL5771857.1 hypothetical protein [Heyndrickxia sporothermodurans]MBL5775938.1 hypothetical protein [Heyndrickxia sporothermodurans]MBL5778927.1 hypothetical protein [Heyndrickxia sporothermodurans]
MTQEKIMELLNQLRTGEIQELYVDNADFYDVRKVLVEQEDFKHFQGIAQRNGHVIYKYLEIPRS